MKRFRVEWSKGFAGSKWWVIIDPNNVALNAAYWPDHKALADADCERLNQLLDEAALIVNAAQ